MAVRKGSIVMKAEHLGRKVKALDGSWSLTLQGNRRAVWGVVFWVGAVCLERGWASQALRLAKRMSLCPVPGGTSKEKLKQDGWVSDSWGWRQDQEAPLWYQKLLVLSPSGLPGIEEADSMK